jgi:cold shock CspA family protein
MSYFGRVVWTDAIVGTGAIASDSIDDDVNFHVTDISSQDRSIGLNTWVKFESMDTPTGPRATDVKVL